jgi:hypothetical protein
VCLRAGKAPRGPPRTIRPLRPPRARLCRLRALRWAWAGVRDPGSPPSRTGSDQTGLCGLRRGVLQAAERRLPNVEWQRPEGPRLAAPERIKIALDPFKHGMLRPHVAPLEPPIPLSVHPLRPRRTVRERPKLGRRASFGPVMVRAPGTFASLDEAQAWAREI